MYSLSGEIKVIMDEVIISEKFKKKSFVLIDDSSQYSQFIQFDLTQERCALINDVAVGDRVTVCFNLRGKEWTNSQGIVRYFNSFDVWRIELKLANPDNSLPLPSMLESDTEDVLPF